ncbi:MAG: ATP-dependent DNA helicase RecG [Lachnospiraceae bacterium]|nr:ATP-dependent DNA helicase RecG [Lachnospiraceae bacterium]
MITADAVASAFFKTMNLSTSVTELKGVGEKTVKLLEKLNIRTVGDLVYDLPRGFMELSEPVLPSIDNVGGLISVRGVIVKGSVHVIKKSRVMTFAKVKLNDSVTLSIMYFNAPYMKKTLEAMDGERVFYGFLSDARGLTITQPAVFMPDDYDQMLKVMQPVYSLTKGISNNQIKKLIKTAFDNVILPDEYLTDEELSEYNMPDMYHALMDLHFPGDMESHKRARRRVAFHEFLTFFIDTHDDTTITRSFDKLMIPVSDTGRLLEALPYELTGAQKCTWKEIEDDMCSGVCMNRMVQGDVGSGKTIVAFLALLLNAANGHQGCMMAPTEVLATQHYENMCKLVDKYKLSIKPRLLIGAVTGKKRKECLEAIESGEANVIIGTQALITDKVTYKDLTLVITDEQHRFGVKQREALADKGAGGVHVLVMSATPIPRSLAMTLYAGIKISVIDELPAGRKKILNSVVGKDYRPAAYKFIAKEVAAGHQAYVICPMIDAGEGLDLENVIDYSTTLRSVLPPEIRVDYLHGRMSLNEKSRLMDEFAAGNIDVLVSTTVIEVGIDVPNATVMMIENADRFGLAALHQIRGRVGRGDAQSYCIFINSGKSEESKERLDVVGKSNDGFYIASEDLRLRGPGEITGIRQSGEFGFKFASIYDDHLILEKVREFADDLYDRRDDGRLEEIVHSIEDYSMGSIALNLMRTV